MQSSLLKQLATSCLRLCTTSQDVIELCGQQDLGLRQKTIHPPFLQFTAVQVRFVCTMFSHIYIDRSSIASEYRYYNSCTWYFCDLYHSFYHHAELRAELKKAKATWVSLKSMSRSKKGDKLQIELLGILVLCTKRSLQSRTRSINQT